MKTPRRILRAIGYTLGAFAFLIVLLAGFTQSKFFKDRLKNILVAEISTRLNGSLDLGSIRGNFLTGFTVDSVAIYCGEEPFFTSGKLTCRYKPLAFLRGILHFKSITFERPALYLKRTQQGEWNVVRLLSPSGETGDGGMGKTLILENLDIRNALVTLIDSSSERGASAGGDSSDDFVHYDNFTLRDLNVRLDGNMKGYECGFNISHASFYSTQPRFELTHLAGSFTFTDRGVSVKDLVLQSGHSYLEVDARLRGEPLGKPIHLPPLKSDSVQLHLSARNIDFGELKSFIPALSFLDGSASVELNAGGKFSDVAVQRLYLKTHKSSLRLAGSIRNLHQPSDLLLDVDIGDSRIDPSDAAKLLPTFNLPTLKDAGQTFLYARYVGKPLDFKSKVSLRGRFGSLETDGHFKFTTPVPEYQFAFKTENLDLQKLFGDLRLRASVTSHGEIQGKGTSMDDLSARLNISVDSSEFQHLLIKHSNIEITALPHHLETAVSLHAHETKVELTGVLDMTDSRAPQFRSEMTLSAFDISRFIEEQKLRTSLNLHAMLSGSGKTVDDANVVAHIMLHPSSIGRYDVAEDTIAFSLDQLDPLNRHLSLRSSLANVSINGMFDLDATAATLRQKVSTLLQAVAQHASLGDTLHGRQEQFLKKIAGHSVGQRKMDFSYSVNVKDLEPLSSILDAVPFNAQGQVDGRVHGSDDVLSIDGKGTFDEFFIGSIHKGVLLHHGTFDVDLNNIAEERTLDLLSGNVDLKIQSGFSKSLIFDSVRASLQYANNKNAFFLSGILDSAVSLSVNGSSSTQPKTYAIDLDNLTLAAGPYIWCNEDDIQLRINRDGIRIMHALMKRGSESISLAGLVADSGLFDVSASLRKCSLRDLHEVLSRPRSSTTAVEGTVSADVHLGGNAESPVIEFEASGDHLSYRGSPIGYAKASIRYANLLANVDVRARSMVTDSSHYLIVSGSIPVNMSPGDVAERFLDKSQYLHVFSEHFNLGLLEPFLPEFQNLTGNVVCDVTITGTPRSPQYAGSLSVKDARFTFVPNNVAYVMSGDLEPSGDKIALKHFNVRNVAEDKVDGNARVEGTLSLKNFRIDNFDLFLYGQLLFMSDETRKIIPLMYGTLFSGMGTNGLHVTGTLERPFLSGNLFVRDANLTFPPARVTSTGTTGLNLAYIVIDDTSKSKEMRRVHSEQFYVRSDTTSAQRLERGFSPEPSLVDRVRYDAMIEAQGPTRIRMIFTPSTNEELYAELDGKVNAVNSTGTPNIYGEITISRNSYYNFFKKFDATGTLKFTGQWDNPELDIKATYEGIRVKDTTEQKVIVELAITGKRYEPKLAMGMKVQLEPGKDPVDWSTQAKGGDVQSDVISFILTGKFRDELTTKDKESIVTSVGSSAGTSAVSGFTSTFLSGMLTDFLRKEFSFIRSAEVTYQGGNLQESADLRLSGEAFKGYWRFGGKIFNDIGNANVNYQVSLGDVFNTTTIRNLFIELERKVEGAEFEEKKLTNAARIYYRISF